MNFREVSSSFCFVRIDSVSRSDGPRPDCRADAGWTGDREIPCWLSLRHLHLLVVVRLLEPVGNLGRPGRPWAGGRRGAADAAAPPAVTAALASALTLRGGRGGLRLGLA